MLISSCTKHKHDLNIEERSTNLEIPAEDIKWHVDTVFKMIVFNTTDDYRKYWQCNQKEKIHEEMNKSKFVSLFKALPKLKKDYEHRNPIGFTQFEATTTLPWFFDEDLVNLTQILNPDGLITIDQYTLRIDDQGDFVYISNYTDLPNSIDRPDLGAPGLVVDAIIDEISIANRVFKYPTDYDIIDMLDEVGIDNGYEQHGFLCWKRGGAQGWNETPAVYFLDETWAPSTLTTQANHSEGTNSNTRIALRLQYLRLGVFFHLVLKAKYQYMYISSGGTRIWKSDVNQNNGENRWSLVFNEKHQGKCKNQNEVFNSGTIIPPLNERNKTRRIFWERANGLHKYQISATLNLFTKSAWRGEKTSQSITVQPNHILILASPRQVNSLEIHNFTPFLISSNY